MNLISEQQRSRLDALPAPESCRLLNFDSADVLVDTPLGYAALFVHGEKPYEAMTVFLQPRIYVQQPDYWGIEIVGCLPPGPVPDVTGTYVAVFPLESPMGKKGIEVIGANGTKEIDVNLSQPGSHQH